VSLSADGSTAIIGAPKFYNGSSGSAYVFVLSGATWVLQATLLQSTPANGDQFGVATALSHDGSRAFVGAPGMNNLKGVVFAFTRSAGAWSAAQVVGTGGATGVLFGEELAADGAGDYVLASAPGSQANIPGVANAFSRSGTTWSADGSTTIDGSTSFDPYSITMAASDDGSTYLVGADTVNSDAGEALVYVRPAIAATSGSGQQAVIDTAFAQPLRATVTDLQGNPVSNGVSVTFTAPSSGVSGAFAGPGAANGGLSDTVLTDAGGVATADPFTANGATGAYSVSAATAGATSAQFNLHNVLVLDTPTATGTAVASGPVLSGSGATTSGQVNLTTLGTADWAHWGLTTTASFDHKAVVTPQIPTYTLTAGGTVGRAGLYTSNYVWSDGTPTLSGSTPTGLYLGGASHRFQLVLPADNATTRTLKLYLGLNKVQATLTATLSDGSAAPFTETVDNPTGTTYRTYSLTYQAASPGQTLTVRWTLQTDHGSGSIQLHAAALSLASVSTATPTNTGTATSTNTRTSTPTITSTPTATGTATAVPGSGTLGAASATTSGQVNLTTQGTVDWAHWGLTAATSFNHKAAVSAQIPTFSLPNGGTVTRYTLYGSGYTWSDGTPTASATTIYGLYLTGAGHTFQLVLPADNSSAHTLKLYLALTKVQAQLSATLSDGSAVPYTNIVDNLTGSTFRTYTITYQAGSPGQTLTITWTMLADHGSGYVQLHAAALALAPAATPTSTGTATSTSTPTATATSTVTSTATATPTNTATVTATSTATAVPAALNGSSAATSGAVNLTTLGTADWAHWGLTTTSFDHKAGVSSQIPTYTLTNGGTVGRAGLYTNNYVWSDGTPTGSASTNTGLYLGGAGHGFQLVLPADNATTRTIKLYLGLNKVQATLTATLSDGSAVPFTDTVDNPTGTSYRTYTLSYRAANPGQTLTVTWSLLTDHGSGSVQLHAATLS
jgi:hypothetical protein